MEPSSPVVARNVTYVLGAQVAIKVLTFGFSILVVRLLGDVEFGRYSAALAYVAVFSMLTDLGASSFSLREIAARRELLPSMTADVLAMRLLLSIAAVVLITASAWMLGKPPDMVLAIFIAAFTLVMYSWQQPLNIALLANDEFGWPALFSVLNQVVFIALGAAALLTGGGYVGLLLASLAATAAMAAAATVAVRRVLRVRLSRPEPRRWVALVRGGLPFGIMGATSIISRRFDTVFMSFVLTDAAVGWYNVPYHITAALLSIPQSIGTAFFPSMVRASLRGRAALAAVVRTALHVLLLLSLPLAAGGTLLADRIVPLLFGDEFRPAVVLLRIMLWSLPSLFLLELLGRTVSALRLERPRAVLGVVQMVVSAALTVVLVNASGVVGAAVAAVLGPLLLVVLSSAIVGPSLVWGDADRLLRILGANVVLVGALLAGRAVPLLDDPAGLAVLVAGGAAVYGLAALAIGAVTPEEARSIARRVWQQLVRPREPAQQAVLGDGPV